nr:unnamed protein product [Haemonchus contortus]
MQICRLCCSYRDEKDCRRTKSKETLLIMLGVMLEKEKIILSDAQSLYNESMRLRKRICKSHFQEAARYIGNLVATRFKMIEDDLFTVPADIMEGIVARFESYRRAIDAKFVLTPFHLAVFYRVFNEQGTEASADSQEMKEPPQLHSVKEEPPSTCDAKQQLSISMSVSDRKEDSQGIMELDETDPKLLSQLFQIEGHQLLKLFRFCPSCGSKISPSLRRVSLTADGTNPIVHYICTACFPYEKRFEGQEAASHSQEGLFRGAGQTTAATTADDTHYEVIPKWADDVNNREGTSLLPEKRIKTEAPDSTLKECKSEMDALLDRKNDSVAKSDRFEKGFTLTQRNQEECKFATALSEMDTRQSSTRAVKQEVD